MKSVLAAICRNRNPFPGHWSLIIPIFLVVLLACALVYLVTFVRTDGIRRQNVSDSITALVGTGHAGAVSPQAAEAPLTVLTYQELGKIPGPTAIVINKVDGCFRCMTRDHMKYAIRDSSGAVHVFRLGGEQADFFSDLKVGDDLKHMSINKEK